ncbi:hypothetical protein CAPTEDRAFT_220723 [Capitella teleta]|uniref:CARD domain-containing protein n=1 Tax=Capitella teleta TaxID=283909 RepID=R7ULV5_CAPTE|nr:hypothetical protein CAPTEDRAFT_220723 [Capitella teleta]|eukprot:ELU07043.1 hypothetical protein CAPTEDRAFT_220723 [Capitella teleta]
MSPIYGHCDLDLSPSTFELSLGHRIAQWVKPLTTIQCRPWGSRSRRSSKPYGTAFRTTQTAFKSQASRHNNTPFEQVGALLDHLAKRTDSDYEIFCKCLKEDNQGHIVTAILEDPSSIRKDIGESLSDCSVHLCDKPRLLLNSVETSYDAEKLSRTAAVKTPAELEIAHIFNHLEELVPKLAASARHDVYEQSIRLAEHCLNSNG